MDLPHPYPLIIVDGSPAEYDDLMDVLNATFKEVIKTVSSGGNLFDQLQQNMSRFTTGSAIILIDANDDQCLELLDMISSKFPDMAPIVCSWNSSPDFMIQCLKHGAVNYVLKPLRHDVVKVLFLNIYRLETKNMRLKEMVPENGSLSLPGESWTRFQDRLKGVFLKENWLPRTIVEYYSPKPSVRRSSLASITSEREQFLKSYICSWDFFPLELNDHELVKCVYLVFDHVFSFPDLVEFRACTSDLFSFIFDACDSYHRTNPYHNFRHAVDVLQATYYFLCKIGIIPPLDGRSNCRPDSATKRQSLFRPLDILALLMACLGHDIGHPGVNNVFMVNSSTPLATLYNDKSVLENFHCMTFFNLFHRHSFGRLSEMPASPEYISFRKIIVHSILATDMSFHDDYIQKIKKLSQKSGGSSLSQMEGDEHDEERLTICGAIIKCADISNCVRAFHIAKRWAVVLSKELKLQGDLERELGMPVAPVNDRDKVSLEDFQLSFKRNVAKNMFEAVAELIPEMSFCIDYLNENMQQWERLKGVSHNGIQTSLDDSVQTSQQETEDPLSFPKGTNVTEDCPTPRKCPEQPLHDAHRTIRKSEPLHRQRCPEHSTTSCHCSIQ